MGLQDLGRSTDATGLIPRRCTQSQLARGFLIRSTGFRTEGGPPMNALALLWLVSPLAPLNTPAPPPDIEAGREDPADAEETPFGASGAASPRTSPRAAAPDDLLPADEPGAAAYPPADRRIADPFKRWPSIPRSPPDPPTRERRAFDAEDQEDDPHRGRSLLDPADGGGAVATVLPRSGGPGRGTVHDEPVLPDLLLAGSQLALVALVPTALLFGHYVLTALTFLLWPCVGYPVLMAYGLTCLGNSLGGKARGATWPVVAALAASTGAWVAVGITIVLAATVLSAVGSAASGGVAALFGGAAILMFAPPIVAGLAALGAYYLVEDDPSPWLGSCAQPKLAVGDDLRWLQKTLAPAPQAAPVEEPLTVPPKPAVTAFGQRF